MIPILIFSLLLLTQTFCLNDRPVIGILTLPLYDQNNFGENTTFIHAQYVKFLEQAGAMVVPIHYNSPPEEIEYILEHINGVLFTGGGLDFIDSKGKLLPFTISAKIIYNKIIQLNQNGINFPLFGTCMGHQLMMFLECLNNDVIQLTDSYDVSNSLKFSFSSQSQSKLFEDFPDYLINTAENEKITKNYHNWSVLTETFWGDFNLWKNYTLLATSKDNKGVEYVANAEHKTFPFYTAQYHPEITQFTFASSDINHSENAREFMFYLALKFVGEARKNDQVFDTYEELVSYLIQTTGVDILKDSQNYFKNSDFNGLSDNIYFENGSKIKFE